MQLINLTPHAIVFPSLNITIPPSGEVARCNEVSVLLPFVTGSIPLIYREYGEVSGLPAPDPDKMYIVSAMVRMALPDRKDLASPGDLVRDGDGKITGCNNLVINP